MQAPELPPNYFDDPDAEPPNLQGHYAGLFTRVAAFVIDALIIAIAIAMIPWITQILLNSIGIGSFTTDWMTGIQRLLASGVFAAVFTYAYYAFFWFFAGMTTEQAAEVLGMTQPKLSKMLRGQFRGISEAKMLDCLTRLGRDVQIVVGPARRKATAGRVAVVFTA